MGALKPLVFIFASFCINCNRTSRRLYGNGIKKNKTNKASNSKAFFGDNREDNTKTIQQIITYVSVPVSQSFHNTCNCWRIIWRVTNYLIPASSGSVFLISQTPSPVPSLTLPSYPASFNNISMSEQTLIGSWDPKNKRPDCTLELYTRCKFQRVKNDERRNKTQ